MRPRSERARACAGRDRAGGAWRRVANDDRDSSLSFPKPVIIRRRKHRLLFDLEAFETRSIAATAPDVTATTAPSPHRRLVKKPQCVGGVVT
jgi:hypothetical protein